MDNNANIISKYMRDLAIDNSMEYSRELQDLINIHNTSLSSFYLSATVTSLMSILIKKGLMTDEEFLTEFNECFNNSPQKPVLENNRDQLLQCIEHENDCNEKFKNIYEMSTGKYDHQNKTSDEYNNEPYDDLDSLYWDLEEDTEDGEDYDIGDLLNLIQSNSVDED